MICPILTRYVISELRPVSAAARAVGGCALFFVTAVQYYT